MDLEEKNRKIQDKTNGYERIFAEQRASYKRCIRILKEWQSRIDSELKEGKITPEEWRMQFDEIDHAFDNVESSMTRYKQVIRKLEEMTRP